MAAITAPDAEGVEAVAPIDALVAVLKQAVADKSVEDAATALRDTNVVLTAEAAVEVLQAVVAAKEADFLQPLLAARKEALVDGCGGLPTAILREAATGEGFPQEATVQLFRHFLTSEWNDQDDPDFSAHPVLAVMNVSVELVKAVLEVPELDLTRTPAHAPPAFQTAIDAADAAGVVAACRTPANSALVDTDKVALPGFNWAVRRHILLLRRSRGKGLPPLAAAALPPPQPAPVIADTLSGCRAVWPTAPPSLLWRVLSANSAEERKAWAAGVELPVRLAARVQGDRPLNYLSRNCATAFMPLLMGGGGVVDSMAELHALQNEPWSPPPGVTFGTPRLVRNLTVLGAVGFDLPAPSPAQLKASVDALLAGGAEVDGGNAQGETGLMQACDRGRADLAHLLLDCGADPHLTNRNNVTALYLACRMNLVTVVKRLLGVEGTKQVVVEGTSPVWITANRGHLEVLRLLLAAGGDVESPNHHKTTALFTAVSQGHEAVAVELVKAGANPDAKNTNNGTPVWVAAETGRHKLLTYLAPRSQLLNVKNVHGATPMFIAAMNGHLECVGELLAAGADQFVRNENKAMPLWIAAEKGHTAIVSLLLENGADVNHGNIHDAPALLGAAEYGHFDIMDMLVAAGSDPKSANKHGAGMAYFAVEYNRPELLPWAAGHGVDPNLRTGTGTTPLIVAGKKGLWDIVVGLMEMGADPSAQDGAGENVLRYAAAAGRLEAVQAILAAGEAQGVDMEPVLNGGEGAARTTPIIAAASGGFEEVALALLAAGASPDALGSGSQRPALAAAAQGELNGLVTALIEAGAAKDGAVAWLVAEDHMGAAQILLDLP